jgi:HK97 gp10 family phage protein
MPLSGATTFTSRIGLAGPMVLALLKTVIDGTGEAIATQTRENMVPGNFYLTGLSRDASLTGPATEAEQQRAVAAAGDNIGTTYESTGPLEGEVRVKTPWAAFAEFGTTKMAARPAMRPAVDQCWPDKVYELARSLP